ncbi:MAG TPA: hypothetical protein ENK51_05640 [Gammaproteobacteria bacterium]|nr:hypothetical protein [Gammaproteobacteria bacterium]
MKNTIEACVAFDFKGQHHVLCIDLDLDQAMSAAGALPPIHALIARHNHIDTYSYEYEMMLAEAIQIRRATGAVKDFIHEGRLDVAAFEDHWRETKALAALRDIARRNLQVDALDRQPALKAALLAAYRLGESAGQRR